MASPPALPPSSSPEDAAALPEDLEAALVALLRAGTPEATLRAYESDLGYLAAWKLARLGEPLSWPESEQVALLFLLDHTRPDAEGRAAAAALAAAGLRRGTAPPAAATLDRRVASWSSFHRMRGLASPFARPRLRAARAKARKAAPRPRPHSQNPITREVLEALLAVPDPTLRGLRDRALLLTAWASGGRRRSEVTGLRLEDVDRGDPDCLWITLRGTKTTRAAETPRLPLKGRAARLLEAWIEAIEPETGPHSGKAAAYGHPALFRPISKADRPLPRVLAADGLRVILRRRLVAAGYPADFASPHGLRAGFLTQAALDGVPLQAAMQLTLHRTPAQAQAYYQEIDIAHNPATELLE